MIRSRLALLAAAYVCIALAVLTFRPMQTPGPFLRDFEAYWSAGAAWNAHAAPYGRAVWHAERTVPGVRAERDELLPFVGPPQTLLLWSAFARLDYVTAARLWFVLLFLAGAALLTACATAAQGRVSAATIPAFIALTLAFGPLSSDLALGQVALVAYAGAVLTAVSRLRTRSFASFAAALVAFAQPNVAVGIVSQLGRIRTAAAVAAALLVTYCAGAIAAGWRWPGSYVALLSAHSQSERGSAIQFTPAAIAHGFGASPQASTAVAAAVAIAAIAGGIAIFRRLRDPFARFAALSALAPFVATFFHEHDLVVTYAAAIWCAVHAQGRLRAAAFVATLLVATDWLGLAQRPTGVVQSALLAVAIACSFLALGKRPHHTAVWVACCAMVALFGSAAWLAATHPVPVWPDALGAFHASARASATQVWFEEQRRSGLLAINPAWSALRCLSLIGCVLLSWLVCRVTGDTERNNPEQACFEPA